MRRRGVVLRPITMSARAAAIGGQTDMESIRSEGAGDHWHLPDGNPALHKS
jgi:hypothetical protein